MLDEKHYVWIRKRFPIFYTIKFNPENIDITELEMLEKQFLQENKLVNDLSNEAKVSYKKIKKIAQETQNQFKLNKHLYKVLANVSTPSELREITLPYKKIKSIQPLRGNNFHTLADVDLSHNQIQDIQPLIKAQIPQIFMLDLAQNQIASLSGLQLCEWNSLKCLKLDTNRIKNIQPLLLGSFPNLKSLDVSKNLIVSIKSYKKFNNSNQLSCIDFSNNHIHSIDSLSRALFPKIDSFTLANNLIPGIKQLQKVYINTPKISQTFHKHREYPSQHHHQHSSENQHRESHIFYSYSTNRNYLLSYSEPIKYEMSRDELILFGPENHSRIRSKHKEYSKIISLSCCSQTKNYYQQNIKQIDCQFSILLVNKHE